MFKSGDLVVFKEGKQVIFEIASTSIEYGCDIWNEDEYLLAVDLSTLRHATVFERQIGYRI